MGLAVSRLSLPGLSETNVSASSLPFEAYHNVTAAQHQDRFNDLSSRGYRLTSISIYGDPADARYPAVWVQRSGPAFTAVHGVTTDGYQSAFNAAVADGFVPVLVSATGPVATARFTAVFEKGITGAWKA